MTLIKQVNEVSSFCSTNSSTSTAESNDIYSIPKRIGNKVTIKKVKSSQEKIYKCHVTGVDQGSLKKISKLEIYKKKKNKVCCRKISKINKYVLVEEIGNSKTLRADHTVRQYLKSQGVVVQDQKLIISELSENLVAIQPQKISYQKIRDKLVSIEQVMSVAEQQLRSVKAMHDAKMVHLDIKPENFLYEMSNLGQFQVFLNDFDTAKEFHYPMGFLSGTYVYMPIEAFPADTLKRALQMDEKIHLSKTVNEKWDIFSLGVNLLKLGVDFLPEGFGREGIEKYLSLKVSMSEMLRRAFTKEVLKERKNLLKDLQGAMEQLPTPSFLRVYFSTVSQMIRIDPSSRLQLKKAIRCFSEILRRYKDVDEKVILNSKKQKLNEIEKKITKRSKHILKLKQRKRKKQNGLQITLHTKQREKIGKERFHLENEPNPLRFLK